MDIEGVGDALATQLVDSGLVHEFADLFRLEEKRDELIALERMGEKSADNLLAAVAKSKTNPLSRLLAALNIPHIGVNTASLLAEHFGSMDALAETTVEALQEIENVGPELAESVHDFLHSRHGKRTIEHLRDVGVNMTQPKK